MVLPRPLVVRKGFATLPAPSVLQLYPLEERIRPFTCLRMSRQGTLGSSVTGGGSEIKRCSTRMVPHRRSRSDQDRIRPFQRCLPLRLVRISCGTSNSRNLRLRLMAGPGVRCLCRRPSRSIGTPVAWMRGESPGQIVFSTFALGQVVDFLTRSKLVPLWVVLAVQKGGLLQAPAVLRGESGCPFAPRCAARRSDSPLAILRRTFVEHTFFFGGLKGCAPPFHWSTRPSDRGQAVQVFASISDLNPPDGFRADPNRSREITGVSSSGKGSIATVPPGLRLLVS